MRWVGWLLVGMVVVASPALGQSREIQTLFCGPGELQEQVLRGKYKEEPVAYGIEKRNLLVELWVSREKDTWTIVLHKPDGRICALASGEGWRVSPGKVKGIRS